MLASPAGDEPRHALSRGLCRRPARRSPRSRSRGADRRRGRASSDSVPPGPSRAPCRRSRSASGISSGSGGGAVRSLQDLELVRALERTPTREQLVEHDAEREDVAARVERLPSACSGDMYATVPTTRPRACRGDLRRGALIARDRRASRARSPRACVACVTRMLPASRRGAACRPRARPRARRRRRASARRSAARSWPGVRPLVERAAVDELGHEVLLTVVLADVVHRDDVRMIERRRHLSFALKAPAAVASTAVAKKLDRDRRLSFVSVAR